MKVSFDFDGTLVRPKVQEYAKELTDRGIEVWIVTTRWDRTSRFFDKQYFNMHGNKSWQEVHEMALKLNIPLKQIKFTNYQWKGAYFDMIDDFLWHLDDNTDEIKYNGSIVPIIIYNGYSWKNKCNRLLNI